MQSFMFHKQERESHASFLVLSNISFLANSTLIMFNGYRLQNSINEFLTLNMQFEKLVIFIINLQSGKCRDILNKQIRANG